MITDIHSEDRLVQATFANHLRDVLGWESLYAHNNEVFGTLQPARLHPSPIGRGAGGEGVPCYLGRASERDVVLVRDLRAAVDRLNPELPEAVRAQAIETLTRVGFARSLIQHNQEFHDFIRNGVPVEWRDASGQTRHARARVIDFRNPANNRFLAVRELKIQGLRVPHYNRRADLVCFVNSLPLVFIELKAVYLNMRAGYDNNLTDYLSETSINHAFRRNAFLIVSNGDRARYGSITSKWEHFAEWKQNDEKDKGSVEAEVLLNGMLAKERLLDLVENFILFDDSRPGGTRKIVARNHQVLGVNSAVASVEKQERLKKEFPPQWRIVRYTLPQEDSWLGRGAEEPAETRPRLEVLDEDEAARDLPLVKRAHPDLDRLGVFWHTQGSVKSYSLVMFTEKVRRHVLRNFTFVIMTDREDLDDQIWRTFVGCGMVDPKTTPRASSGKDLKEALKQNHSFVFTLIHKFNQPVDERDSYSERDDIIVISDEAHRTQAGKLARNMRLALPNASFIGFTGTPLFKYDHLTRRIFGGYISRYDFKRSEEDQSTVKLVYENRGEELGIARLDLNDRIAEQIDQAGLDADQEALLEKLLGQDYEVITADDRLDKLAAEHHHRDHHQRGTKRSPRFQQVGLRHHPAPDGDEERPRDGRRQAGECRRRFQERSASLPRRHRLRDVADGLRRRVPANALHRPAAQGAHPHAGHRPREPHLPGQGLRRDRGLQRHAQEPAGRAGGLCAGRCRREGREADPAIPLEEYVPALAQAIEAAEKHLRDLGFDPDRLTGATGFTRIAALRDAVDALYTTDESKRRFEIMAREVFSRMKTLILEPSVRPYYIRHDNI
jgi:type I restriction enzyme R subunit